ncbi:hypothetical protein ACXDF8_24280 [Mycolicibacterium sp. CBM1]
MKFTAAKLATAIGGVLVAGSLALAGPALAGPTIAGHGGNAIPGEPAPAAQVQVQPVAAGQPSTPGRGVGAELPVAPVG